MKKSPIDKWVIDPVTRFMDNSISSSLVLFSASLIALVWANSPWSDSYFSIWKHTLTIGYDHFLISKDLHHWINDGLMGIFFFVVGLEIKREIIAGELSNPKDAILPLMAGLGGMIFPAGIYLFINRGLPSASGWGIPMATDIAFALGLLYLLGKRIPLSLKIMLTALAIADDLGAVLVIAFFYTSELSMLNLSIGLGFLSILILANILGVRNTVFYGLMGIGGLWLAFLLSGIHATIAGVLAAFTIPGTVKIQEIQFLDRVRKLTADFEDAERNNVALVTKEQLVILGQIRFFAKAAQTPLQRLEHAMHPLVVYVVMPVFALANAGIRFEMESGFLEFIRDPVVTGIFLGLLLGKLVGISGMVKLIILLKWAQLPEGVTWRHIYGMSLLAGVGFTMSLFITELAFTGTQYTIAAKTSILITSVISGTLGYLVLRSAPSSESNLTKR